jgi:hypothetical protein
MEKLLIITPFMFLQQARLMPALRGYRVSSRSAVTNSKQLLLERAKQKEPIT